VSAGRYEKPGDVVAAALTRLMQDDGDDAFAPGELNALVQEGEADIARGDTLTLDQVRPHFRSRRAEPRH
jgi:Arc/MetJ-type ribon-helix-helix transcriptional regulator